MWGTRTLVSPPGTQRAQRPLGRQGQSRNADRSAERQAGLRGTAWCFVLITNEMLTCASPGDSEGETSPASVEELLQTVRKTQVSIGGGERASGPGKRTFLTPGRQWESPNTTLRRSLLADCSAAQHSGLAWRAWGVPRTVWPPAS